MLTFKFRLEPELLSNILKFLPSSFHSKWALISLRIMALINVVLGYCQGVDRGYLRNSTNAFIFTEIAIGLLWFACFVKERYTRVFMVFIMLGMAIDTLLDMVMPISLPGPSTIDVPYLVAMIAIPTFGVFFPFHETNLCGPNSGNSQSLGQLLAQPQ